ncbi:MAG: hypothetical protein HRU69_05825 [Flammeovirgaceae bacterium]|nr:MAG: hypothetical protein HRU69_05825 [Flammeovirgaceae bacterium]
MEEVKLTLKLKKRTIERGKRFARKQKTSLSKMIENYLDKVTQQESDELTPLVRSLSGVLKGKSLDYKRGYSDFLDRKYK